MSAKMGNRSAPQPAAGPEAAASGRSEVQDWLFAGLGLVRVAAAEPEVLAQWLPLLKAVHSESGILPPAAVAFDVALLLTGKRLDTSAALSPHEPKLRRALRAYDDQVLARLVNERHFLAARDALRRYAPTARAHGIALLLSLLMERLGFEPRVRVGPGLVRRVVQLSPEAALASGFASWRSSSDSLRLLAEDYRLLALGARRLASLLQPSDVFLLEHLEVTSSLAQRVALGQIIDAADAFVSSWPRRLTVKARSGASPTKLEGESSYPAGGFAALSNRGTLENVVASELVYMDRSSPIDLFDIRYVEGELLYYGRDEGFLARQRRHVVFLLHPSLENARVKDANLTWQRVILVLALMVAWTRRLHRWLGDEDLVLSFWFWQKSGKNPYLSEEEALLSLGLGEWIERGTTEVASVVEENLLERIRSNHDDPAPEVVLCGDETALAEWDALTEKERWAPAEPLFPTASSWDVWVQRGAELLARFC